MLLEKVREGKDEKETAYFPFPPPAYFALSPRTPLGLIFIKSVLSRNYSVTRVRFRYSWMDGFLECDRGERKRLNDLNRGKFRIIFRNEDESNSINIWSILSRSRYVDCMQTKLNPIKYLSSKLPQFARATKKNWKS